MQTTNTHGGIVFRTARTTLGQSRREVATATGLSVSTLGRIERGDRHVYDFESEYWGLINHYATSLAGVL